MAKLKQFAIIDGANVEDLLDKIEELDPPSCCLYAEPIDPDLIALAPYLVEVTEDIESWLDNHKSPWGMYLTSKATLRELRKHLRKYLRALLPDEPVPVTFRFYDPRNIWNLCTVFDDWQLHSLMGPVLSIKTTFDDLVIEDDFKARRDQFPDGAISKQLVFKITDDQLQQLNKFSLVKYSQEIASLMHDWYQEFQVIPTQKEAANESVTMIYDEAPIVDEDGSTSTINADQIDDFSLELIAYLNTHNIQDDRSIRGLAKLMMMSNITALEQLPLDVKRQLEQENVQGDVKATDLLIEYLGAVPV